jgi:hypothetical protein
MNSTLPYDHNDGSMNPPQPLWELLWSQFSMAAALTHRKSKVRVKTTERINDIWRFCLEECEQLHEAHTNIS